MLLLLINNNYNIIIILIIYYISISLLNLSHPLVTDFIRRTTEITEFPVLSPLT